MSASDPQVASTSSNFVSVTGRAAEFDVYGLRVRIEGRWPAVLESLGHDFAWFAHQRAGPSSGVASRPSPDPTVIPRSGDDSKVGCRPNRPLVVVRVARRPPDFGRFGEVPQAFITTRNTVFQSGAQTIVDYSGEVLALYDRSRDELLIEGEDEQLVHEAAYLFLLSRIGRHLDESHLMRIHALGLSGGQGALLLLLPSGGGKTTLALHALGAPGIKLLSEDTPILDRHGLVHPFPLRIGVNPGDAELLPEGEVRRIERLEYGPKLLLSVDAVADRIEPTPQPLRHVVLGHRWLSGGGSLSELPRRDLVGPLIRDGVIGVGVAQMIEYVLRQGARDFVRQGGVAAGRAVCCGRALIGTSAWRLDLSRDSARNWAALEPLLR